MLKFLIILILIIYVLARVGGYLFKIFFIGASEAQRKTSYNQGRRRAHNGDLDIEYRESPDKNDAKGYSGGEYIDYEEVEK